MPCFVERLFRLPPMRRAERLTLRYSYFGEFGRGLLAAAGAEFALIVAIGHFGLRNSDPVDRTLLWLISSAIAIGMVAALFGVPLTRRRRKTRVVLWAEGLARFAALLAALAPNGPAFAILIAAAMALNVFAVPLTTGLYGQNFRSGVRGHAVGSLVSLMSGTAAVFAALCGWLVDLDPGLYRLLLLGLAAVSLACSQYAYRHIPEPAASGRRPQSHRSLRDYLGVFRHDLAFLYLEVVWFLIGICNLSLIPVRVLHLNESGFSDLQIMVATVTVNQAVMVLSVALWGRVIYTMNFAVHRIWLSVLFALSTWLFFTTESFLLVCLAMAAWGLALGGGQLSWRLIATFFTRPGRVPLYMGVHAFLFGVRGLLGPFLSLNLHEDYGARFVGALAAGGFALSALLLVPLYPVMQRRRARIEGAAGTPAKD